MAAMRPASLKRNADKRLVAVMALAYSFEYLLESDGANDEARYRQPGGEIVAQARVNDKADRSDAQKDHTELLVLALALLRKHALNVRELSALSFLGGRYQVYSAGGEQEISR